MTNVLSFSFGALLLIAALSAYTQILAPPAILVSGDRMTFLGGRVAGGQFKNWLCIETFNGENWKKDGYAPSATRIVSDYKPMFRQASNGQWEIIFVP